MDVPLKLPFILFYFINCHYNEGKPRNTLAFKLKQLVCARRGSFAGLSSILIPRGSSLGESWGEVGGGGGQCDLELPMR